MLLKTSYLLCEVIFIFGGGGGGGGGGVYPQMLKNYTYLHCVCLSDPHYLAFSSTVSHAMS